MKGHQIGKIKTFNSGRFRRLGRCFIDWATAVVGEGDPCQLSISFTYHSSGPIFDTMGQSTEFDSIYFGGPFLKQNRMVMMSWRNESHVAKTGKDILPGLKLQR